MKLINLLGHPVKLIAVDGREIEIPSAGFELRVLQETVPVGDWNGVPLLRTRFGAPAVPLHYLPEWSSGACYIVSAIVARAVQEFFPEHAERFLVPGRTVRGEGFGTLARALIIGEQLKSDRDGG